MTNRRKGRGTPARRGAVQARQVVPEVPGLELRVTSQKLHVGPLPTPEDLIAYEQAHQGLAERIIRTVEIPLEMGERQQEHRHHIEKLVIRSDIRRSWTGLILGFIALSGLMVLGFVLVLDDKDLQGLAAIAGALATMVTALVHSTRARNQQLEAKRPE